MVDDEGIKEMNDKYAANSRKYIVTRGICLDPNALAKPITLTDISTSINGCASVTAIVRCGRNALSVNVIQEWKLASALSRDKMEAQIIQGLSGIVNL